MCRAAGFGFWACGGTMGFEKALLRFEGALEAGFDESKPGL
jgi:hypothetical protein